MKIKEMSQKKMSVFLLISIIINIIFIFFIIQLNNKIKENKRDFSEKLNEFELISSDIAFLDINSFKEKQKQYSLQFYDLKNQISLELKKSKGHYGIYFEDINTGTSIGINEKEDFIPQSLFKVPLMVAILKKVEEEQISLEDNLTLSKYDLDSFYGDLYKKGIGYNSSIRELLTILIKKSDNTAMNVLSNNLINKEDYLTVLSVMGLPESKDDSVYVSPKEYSNMFKSLYFSNYLKRPFSELALSVMLETEFKDQLSSGIPKNIKISHKFGVDNTSGVYHDCGIIYFPNTPYLLCVMSKNNTQTEANSVISNISKITYNFMKNKSTHI